MSQNGEYPQKVLPNEWSARGWQDYLAGRAFPCEYDSWSQTQQRHYERGRLRAAAAPQIYRRIPANEPFDIVRRTNGLRLVPKSRRRGLPPPPQPMAQEY
jgi:hypothetical protein